MSVQFRPKTTKQQTKDQYEFETTKVMVTTKVPTYVAAAFPQRSTNHNKPLVCGAEPIDDQLCEAGLYWFPELYATATVGTTVRVNGLQSGKV